MRTEQEEMRELLWQDYRMQEAQLRLWVEAAEETLRREERFQCVSDLLLWAKTEFRRRCRYLGQEEPPLERRAGELLRALANGAAGAQTQGDQKNG